MPVKLMTRLGNISDHDVQPRNLAMKKLEKDNGKIFHAEEKVEKSGENLT